MKYVCYSTGVDCVAFSRWPLAPLTLLLCVASAASQDRAAQFKPLAAELAERRLAGAEETEAEQTRALEQIGRAHV